MVTHGVAALEGSRARYLCSVTYLAAVVALNFAWAWLLFTPPADMPGDMTIGLAYGVPVLAFAVILFGGAVAVWRRKLPRDVLIFVGLGVAAADLLFSSVLAVFVWSIATSLDAF